MHREFVCNTKSSNIASRLTRNISRVWRSNHELTINTYLILKVMYVIIIAENKYIHAWEGGLASHSHRLNRPYVRALCWHYNPRLQEAARCSCTIITFCFLHTPTPPILGFSARNLLTANWPHTTQHCCERLHHPALDTTTGRCTPCNNTITLY